jgi:NCS1 family nucleobase:cation symporter-1
MSTNLNSADFSGNYWVEDLYTDDPKGRYWYNGGFHWRAYAAYVCGIVVPFPGFVGAISGDKYGQISNAAAKIYTFGYLLSFTIGAVVYFAICKISPPPHVAEARALPFESMGEREVLIAISRPVSVGQDSDLPIESSEKHLGSKGDM